MISVKELRIGNIVKDKDGNIWRIGCITGMHKDKGSLILERRIDNGTIKWYTSECDVYPISLNERILELIHIYYMVKNYLPQPFILNKLLYHRSRYFYFLFTNIFI